MLIEAGIISFATWLVGKIADKGFDTVVENLKSKDDIDAMFKQCVEFVANKLEKKYPDILGNSIGYFFTQEEVFGELIKLLFVNQKVNKEVIAQSFDTSTLPKDFILEFVTELKTKVQQETVFQELLANQELYVALKGIAEKAENISKNSTLKAKEITEIRKLLEEQFKKQFNLSNYISGYTKNLINNIKPVNFLGLGIDPSIRKGKHKDLDSIFVKPRFQINSKYHLEVEKQENKDVLESDLEDYFEDFEEKDKISFNHLFDNNYNYIILGNAGAGKSLLVKAIMLYISENSKEFNNEDILNYIPFSIELKKYLAFKKQGSNGCSILKYLIYSLEKDYSSDILEDNLREILQKEKVILFFDGLDEIFNVGDKIAIKQDIENFHNNFPNIKSITTSRFTGYNEAKFDEKKFCELSILPFSDEQIEEYVQKWYRVEKEDVGKFEISDCVSQIQMTNIDYRNPLLLSLVVILYHNNFTIPESKFEIYQSCTNTLVDKWDAEKKLNIEIDSRMLQKKESILSDLAFWQYEILSSPTPTITYHKAKTTIAEALVKKKLADEDNKDVLAESFLDYAQKRSIYFDNNFTHKTFLEYYTAYWIYSNIEKKYDIEKRNEIIKLYITKPFWYIVLELLLNLIDKDQPDTEILDGIIEENSNNTSSLAFLLYVLPSLKNISDDTQILVYTKTIEHILALKANEPKKIVRRGRVKNNLFEKIQENSINPKQKEIINKSINNFINKDLTFYVLMEELDRTRFDNDSVKFDFNEIRNDSVYKELLKKDSHLFFLLSYRTFNNENNYFETTLKYIELFGVDSLFDRHNLWFGNGIFVNFINYYLYNQLSSLNKNSLYENLEILENNSLSKIRLLKYLLENTFYPRLNDEVTQYLLNTTEKADGIEKVINLILLKKSFKKIFGNNERNKNIEDFNATFQIKSFIQKNMKYKEILEEIINEFKISDKEILELNEDLKLEKE